MQHKQSVPTFNMILFPITDVWYISIEPFKFKFSLIETQFKILEIILFDSKLLKLIS